MKISSGYFRKEMAFLRLQVLFDARVIQSYFVLEIILGLCIIEESQIETYLSVENSGCLTSIAIAKC